MIANRYIAPGLMAALSLSLAGTARAFGPAPSLDDPVIQQTLTVAPANNGYTQVSYSTIGANREDAGVFIVPGVSGGFASSFAYLGASPTVFAEGSATYSGGESAFSSELYDFEYVNPGAGTTPVAINFTGNDIITGSDSNASAQALVFIAPYGQLNNFPLTLAAGDCDFGGVLGCAGDDNTDFAAVPTMSSITSIMVTPNTVYQVMLFADAGDAGGTPATPVTASALVDPTLSLPSGTPGSLVFSAGVTVPEPGTWLLILGGAGFVGAGLRLRRRRVDTPAQV